MKRVAHVTSIAWLLWMEPKAIIYRHEMAFPFISKYERKGQSVAMFVNEDKLVDGNLFGKSLKLLWSQLYSRSVTEAHMTGR